MARDRYNVDHKPYTLVVRVQGRTLTAVRRAADRAGVSTSVWLRGLIEDATQESLPFDDAPHHVRSLAEAIAAHVERGPDDS